MLLPSKQSTQPSVANLFRDNLLAWHHHQRPNVLRDTTASIKLPHIPSSHHTFHQATTHSIKPPHIPSSHHTLHQATTHSIKPPHIPSSHHTFHQAIKTSPRHCTSFKPLHFLPQKKAGRLHKTRQLQEGQLSFSRWPLNTHQQIVRNDCLFKTLLQGL